MAIPTLSGSYIDETYGRLVQISGSEFADGFGNPISFGGGPGGAINTIQINKDGTNFTGSANLTFVGNNINLTGSLLLSQSHISNVDYIDFNPNLAVDPAFTTGRIHWVDDTKTLGLDTDVNGSVIELGHQHVVRVVNDTGVTISKSRVVYITGSVGTRPGIATASYTDENDSATTLGFVMHDIVGTGGNKNGYVVTRGMIREVNTSGLKAGESLYLSSSGQYTTVKPQAPLHEVRLGKVVVGGSANAGVIYVDIQNGFEIDELHNVRIIGDTTGDLIIKSGSLWINSKQLSGSYTINGSLTISGSLNVTGGVTASLQGTSSWATNALTSSTSTITFTNTAGGVHYLTFVSGTTNPNDLRVDAGLSYLPSTNTLTVAQLTGNALTATTANAVTITEQPTGTGFLTFVQSNSGGNSVFVDSTGLTFNATTNTLTTTNFAGTASLATTASFVSTASFANTAVLATTASSADNFTIRGNLVVSGSTTIGDSTTDSITMTAATMSLGGNLNIDSNTLFVDGGTNRVGIGKIPTTTLDINGNTVITGSLNVSGSVLFPNLSAGTSTNVVMQGANGQLFITASSAVGGGISGIEVQSNGGVVQNPATILNFTGSGVSVVAETGVIVINIPGSVTQTVNAKVIPTGNGAIITFDPTLYYSCFIDYHVFLYDAGAPSVMASRAGNIRISVPHDYSTQSGNNNIPFVENTTEYRSDPSTTTVTTEDIYFKANYDGTNIVLSMYNDNGTYDAQINLQYRLIGYTITP